MSTVTYNKVLTLIGAVCLAYITAYVSLILSDLYPELRFFGKYVFIVAGLCIILLTFKKGFKLRKLPGYFSIPAFTIYFVIHCIIFENVGLEPFGFSVLVIYLLGISFWMLVSSEADLLQVLYVVWISLFAALGYYVGFVVETGDLVVRITPEDMDLEINGNTLCFMSAIFVIVSIRIYEIYSNSAAMKNSGRRSIAFFIMFSIAFSSLLFSFWHLNMVSTFLNLISLSCILYRYGDKSTKIGLLASFLLAVYFMNFSYLDRDFSEQLEIYFERVESASSLAQRLDSLIYVFEQWLINPIFGASKNFTIDDGSGKSNHTFYVNILAIYGVVGFSIFTSVIFSIMLPGIKNMTLSQMLARIFFLVVWLVAPTTYPQAIALLVMLPRRYYIDYKKIVRNSI